MTDSALGPSAPAPLEMEARLPTFTNPIPIGSDPWGAVVNDNFEELMRMQANTQARDHGLAVWSFDPASNSGSSTLTLGSPFMAKLPIRLPVTVTHAIASMTTLGTGLTVGQNFAGLYDSSGVRIAVTADLTAQWGSTGYQKMAFTAPVDLTTGFYYLALLINGSTSPSWARGSVSGSGPSTINGELTAADGRYATGPAGQTSLPANITMASRTLSAISLWAGLI